MSRHKKAHKHNRKGSKKERGRGSASSNGSTDSDGIVGTSSTRRAKRCLKRENGRRSSVSSSDSTFSECSSLAHWKLFPERAKNSNNFDQKIVIRKTRWGPMLNEQSEAMERRREKPMAKDKNERHRRRQRSFSRGKSEPKQNAGKCPPSLLSFVDDRKQLANEVLDSLDVRTRNRIFPELKRMSGTEAQRIVYGFINGISKKRILALLQRRNFSESSSTSDFDECPNSIPSTSSELPNRSTKENPNEPDYPIKTKTNLWKERRKVLKNRRKKELEEGEVISDETEEREGRDSAQMEETTDSERGKRTTEKEEREREEDGTAAAEGAAFEDGHGQSEDDSRNLTDCEGADQLVRQRQRVEPQFVISLGISPPCANSECAVDFSEDESDDGTIGQRQRIICILSSPSPTATIIVGIPSDGQLSEGGEAEDNCIEQGTPPTDYNDLEEQSLNVRIAVIEEDAEQGESELSEERKTGEEALVEEGCRTATCEGEETPPSESGHELGNCKIQMDYAETSKAEQHDIEDDEDDLLIELIDE